MPFDTMEIERHLVKLLSGNKMMARLHAHSAKSEWFTGNRRFIFDIFKEVFLETSSPLTDELLKAEINKRFPDALQEDERKRYLTEWTLIKACDVHETADALIDKLKEKSRIDSITDICQRTISAIKSGDPDKAASIIKSDSVRLDTGSLNKPLIDTTNIVEMKKLIADRRSDPNKYAGVKIGFPRFDNATGGLFPSEMTLISAVTGVGKSTLIKQIVFNVAKGEADHADPTARWPGRNVLHVTNEEHRDQVQMKYIALAANVDYLKIKNATLDDDEMQRIEDAIKRMQSPGWGKIFIKEISQFENISDGIYTPFYELESQGFKIGMVALDYLDHLSPIQKSWSENDEQAKTAWDFKAMTVDLNIPGITATQAATIVEDRMEKGKRFGKLNVYGSKRRVHASNTVIGVMITGYDESQIGKDGRMEADDCDRIWTADILKQRDGAPFMFNLRHEVKSGRVREATTAEATAAASAIEKKKEEAKKTEDKKPEEKKSEPIVVKIEKPEIETEKVEIAPEPSETPVVELTTPDPVALPPEPSEAPTVDGNANAAAPVPEMPFKGFKTLSPSALERIRKSRDRFENNL